MSAVGHPIIGDVFYAPEAVRSRSPRLCLHAEELSVAHPTSGQRMVFTSPAPAGWSTGLGGG
jgi:tRNA pseudouridine32 synthase/23S rRNA pseudouridine746 synthase